MTTTTATDLPSTTGPPVPSTATYAARPLPPGKNCDLEAMLTGMFKAMNRLRSGSNVQGLICFNFASYLQ